MGLFKEILSEMMLLEMVSPSDVVSAIDNHERIIVNYNTKGKNKNTGARVVEVYAYGLTRSGMPCIRVFQPYGDTTTRVPNWKIFRLDRIMSWKPTGQKFTKPADVYYHNIGNFNPDGDGTMSIVYKMIKFNDDNDMSFGKDAAQIGKPKLKDNDRVYTTDTENRFERLKNQLNNPININDIMAKNGFKGLSSMQNKSLESGPKVKPQSNNNNSEYEKQIADLRNKIGDNTEPISYDNFQKLMNDVVNNNTDKNDNTFKTDTEKQMEKLRNQLANPQKIDLSRIPKR